MSDFLYWLLVFGVTTLIVTGLLLALVGVAVLILHFVGAA